MKGKSVVRGVIVHAPEFGSLNILENGFILLQNGRIEDISCSLPPQYRDAPQTDYGSCLIIPSFADMHLHAPQYPMIGLGLDKKLLEWLEAYTFPTEAKFADAAYARKVYRIFAGDLVNKGTTRVCVFSSIHRAATHVLMEELELAGITGYAGKVNMDSNCPPSLRESAEDSLSETRRWVMECKNSYSAIKPILTPRFAPSCSNSLLAGLGELAGEFGLPVQSHLSESIDEIKWVRELFPDCRRYWEVYDKYGLFGGFTAMAHCVYSDKEERRAMAVRGVTAVHCPESNINLSSGAAHVRRMTEEGVRVALGTDIAGGAELSMMRAVTAAIRTSKLISHGSDSPLSAAEAFYMATSAGQAFFGAGPGFKKGDMLHAVVLSDAELPKTLTLSTAERLERLLYFAQDSSILAVYSEGKRIKP